MKMKKKTKPFFDRMTRKELIPYMEELETEEEA